MNAFGYSLAYILPAAFFWGVAAIALYPLTFISHLMAILAWVYATLFGLLEAIGIPFRPLGSTWQIPAHWLKGRSGKTQTLIWGIALGPGFLTRNLYAGMWLLLFLLPLQHGLTAMMLAGCVVGAAHGAARAIGILYNHRHPSKGALMTVLAQTHWRVADGILLVFVAGSLTALFY